MILTIGISFLEWKLTGFLACANKYESIILQNSIISILLTS